MKPEQIVQPLHATILRPSDHSTPKQIVVATPIPPSMEQMQITVYFSTEGLSFSTMQKVREELGLPKINSQEELDMELAKLTGAVPQ